MMKKVIVMFISSFILAGCSTIINSLLGNNQTANSQTTKLYKLTSFKEADVFASLGVEYGELQGKVFYIYSTGDSNMNAPEVMNWALMRAATVVYNLGFPAFTILDQYAGSEIRNETYYETYTEIVYTTYWVSRKESVQVPQNVVRTRPQTRQVLIYYCNLLIIGITEDEFTDAGYVYRVSQYLPVGYVK